MEMEPSSRNIFWGLVVKPGKRYETEVCILPHDEKLTYRVVTGTPPKNFKYRQVNLG